LAKDQIAIGVVAPASRIEPALAEAVKAHATRLYPENTPRIDFHPQCFASSGHFAGDDTARANAFVAMANDPAYDAVWFARGGYGSGRLIEAVLPRLDQPARTKTYLGYSDGGALLGALYGAGFKGCAHGPVAQDLRRDGGEAAVARALAWLVERSADSLEPTVLTGAATAAFNMAILSSMMGAPWMPNLEDHVLMLEEVSEHIYRIDRFLLQITSNPRIRKARGLMLGRCSLIPDNDPDFGMDEEAVAKFWCARSGIPYLGRADIGHDIGNKIVPFGHARL